MKLFWLSVIACLILSVAFIKAEENIGVSHTVSYYKTEALAFAKASAALRLAVGQARKNDPATIEKAKAALSHCRACYKRIEFFLEHFITVTARPFNLPPVYEVEEPFMEFQQPRGMQLMEAILFSDDVDADSVVLRENAELVYTYASDLHALLYDLNITDEEVVESLRMELLRVITLGITGFDAPELKTGINESLEALKSIEYVLQPYLSHANEQTQRNIGNSLSLAMNLLQHAKSFDQFNRMQFLTTAALPLQQELNNLFMQLFPGSRIGSPLSTKTPTVFSQGALTAFADSNAANPALSELGRQLFFEKQLSANGKRSCATCHDPRLHFTDGLAMSVAITDTEFVSRNAPTLLYASFQHGLFWDARAQTMEKQVEEVLLNKKEMDMQSGLVKTHLRKNKTYRQLFTSAFPGAKKDSLFSLGNIARAIAAFERSLAPMNSPFDRYIRGNHAALTPEQVSGFNLFMGKAQCGTCHFAPLFNGLLPPAYEITELEVLGTTANTDMDHPQYDADSGRYHFFPIEYNNRAFKTPTVRNVAKTGPYMHNGAFKTLQQVMDFYNKGGGEGAGLHIQHQTLSAKPLGLTENEMKQVISFMEALTDSISF